MGSIGRAAPAGLTAALDRLARDAVAHSRRGATILLVTDRAWSMDRLPVPSILSTGAVHTALTAAGLRGRTDIAVSAVDIFDVHAMAMVLAVGATAVQPRLAIELAAELAGTRGAEEKGPADTVGSLLDAFEAGLRKTLARMGISAVSSYIGGALIDIVDLDAAVVARCFPTAAAWPGRTTLDELAVAPASPPRCGPGHPGTRGRPRATAARPGLRPLPGRWRDAPLLAADRDRDDVAGRRRRRRNRDRRHRRPAGSIPVCPGPLARRSRGPARRTAHSSRADPRRRSPRWRTPPRSCAGSWSRP